MTLSATDGNDLLVALEWGQRALGAEKNSELIFQVRQLIFWIQAVHMYGNLEKSFGCDLSKLPFMPPRPQSRVFTRLARES